MSDAPDGQPPAPPTLRSAIAEAARRMQANPDLAADAARDAELLLLHVLSLPRSAVYADPGRPLDDQDLSAYRAAVDRRLQCEPIQYITGRQGFFGLEMEVEDGVLIPRPETELLVEAVLDRLPRDRTVEILDVGTGTGAIAIALASRLPHARLIAVDLSAEALAIASRNVSRHGLDGRVKLLVSDLLEGLPAASQFDAIVSNPPYIPDADRATLHPQVRDHEPALALFAGIDGLSVYRRLIPQAYVALRPGGLLALEIGFGQRGRIMGLLHGWQALQVLDDVQGIARVVLARRP